jgi:hypothetical protein
MTKVNPGTGTKALEAKLRAAGVRFDPGRMVMTPGAVEVLANNNELVSKYLTRHVSGDWGELDDSDCLANEASLKNGTRLLSSYVLGNKERIWIITDAVDFEAGANPFKRRVTTVLLPSDY